MSKSSFNVYTQEVQASSSSLASKTSSNFCIDALLAKENPIRSPPSTESVTSGSPRTTPDVSPGVRSTESPILMNGVENSNVHQLEQNAHFSSLWSPRPSSVFHLSSQIQHSTHPSSSSVNSSNPMSLFSSGVSNHPLYAAMYGGMHHGNPNGLNQSQGGVPAGGSHMPLIHGSAFHSPLHDVKGHHGSGSLSMDWLARAGLLYHRTPGKQFSTIKFNLI